jgi:UDP-N-acetylglucosamine 1-carboxyvinyltransferase
MTETYLDRIGGLIRDARKHRGLTQTQLADVLGTSQSAVHRIEAGNQNLSLEMVNRIAEALDSPLISVGGTGPLHLRVQGGANLTGMIDVRSSKNAAVGLLCASLLNRGRTVIRGIAKIEEVNRILEVLTSIGVRATWSPDGNDLELVRPAELSLDEMDLEAARRTRSVILFLGPLLHSYSAFKLPYAGGCDIGARTIEPHLQLLRRFGLHVHPTDGFYHCTVDESVEPARTTWSKTCVSSLPTSESRSMASGRPRCGYTVSRASTPMSNSRRQRIPLRR